MTGYVFLFIFGGIVGATFDGFHTHSFTDAYYHPQFLKTEWWVPPLFGAATLGIALSHLDFDRRFQRDVAPRPWNEIAAGLVLFTLQYFASGFMKVDPVLRTAFQAAFAFGLWLAFEGTFTGLLLAFATALVGCVVEIVLIVSGKFHYVLGDIGANVMGIPLWLPFLYVSGSVTVGNLARKMFARRRAFAP